MLGTENQIAIEFVVEEIMKTNIGKTSKIKLLERLKKYEGYSDDFSFINTEISKVKKKYNLKK